MIFVILVLFQLIPENTFQSVDNCTQTVSEYLKEHPEYSSYSVDQAHEMMRGGKFNTLNCPLTANVHLIVSCDPMSLMLYGYPNGECKSGSGNTKQFKSR
eukprot:259825_1